MAFNPNGYVSPITRFANEVVHMIFLYFAPGESAPCPITKLPNEVVHMIFAYLTPGEVANLRLLSRSMAVVGLHYLVPTVHLHLEEDSFNKLRDIANHPVVCKHVYELIYEVDRLESLSWEEWSTRIMGAGYNGSRYRGPPGPPRQNASATTMQAYNHLLKMYLSLPVHRYAPRQIQKEWDQYNDAYIKQWNICHSSSLLGELGDALRKLPNLRSVRTSSQNTMTRWVEGFTQRFGASWDQYALTFDTPMADWKVGLCSVQSILSALGHHNLPITTLYLFGLNWQILAQDEKDFMLIKQSFRHLKNLSLIFTGRVTRREGATFVSANRYDSDAFRRIGQRGRLVELLSAAPDLEALTISFAKCDFTISNPLQHTFGRFHWHSLRSLELVDFEPSENELLDFLSRHADSLHAVCLRFIHLQDGTWSTTLHRMRQTLKLEEANVWELAEDVGRTRVWDMHKEVKIWDEECKVSVSSYLGKLVEQYLQQHDKEDMTFEAYLTSLHIGSLAEVLGFH